MPDYRSMVDAYNSRKRNNGNWVIVVCILLLIISFAIVVFLSNIVIKRNTEIRSIKEKLSPGALSDSNATPLKATRSPIIIEDSLNNIILRLTDSIEKLKQPVRAHSAHMQRWPSTAVVTLFESRFNDTVALPFFLGNVDAVGDYILNIQIKNILGYEISPGEVQYNSNPAFTIDLNRLKPIDDGGNYVLTIRLKEQDRNKLSSDDASPVFIFVNFYKSGGHTKIKALKLKLIPKW